MQSFSLPRVDGYKISKLKNEKYSVTLDNGNAGAKLLNKNEYDQFMKEKRAEGQVKPSYALLTALVTFGSLATAAILDFAFARGKHVKQICAKLGINDFIDFIALSLP